MENNHFNLFQVIDSLQPIAKKVEKASQDVSTLVKNYIPKTTNTTPVQTNTVLVKPDRSDGYTLMKDPYTLGLIIIALVITFFFLLKK